MNLNMKETFCKMSTFTSKFKNAQERLIHTTIGPLTQGEFCFANEDMSQTRSLPNDDRNVQDISSTKIITTDKEIYAQKSLSSLSLTPFFPYELKVREMRQKMSSKLESLSDIPWHFLLKIMMLDYRGRDDIVPSEMESKSSTYLSHSCTDVDDVVDGKEDLSAIPHPMDVLILIFRCSSNHVRQILCEKMFMCKLSVPLLIPPFRPTICHSMFFLWALRGITLEFKQPCGELHQVSAVRADIPVVSCLRLGEISRSKSQFLNEMVNNGQHHPTFFHKDCKNGTNKRQLTDGLIEIAWRLPSGECNGSQTAVAFLNLRGDGVQLENSREFLCEISDVVLVMVGLDEIQNPSTVRAMKSITSAEVEVVLVVTKISNTKEEVTRKINFENFKKDDVILDFNMNMKTLKDRVECKIRNCLKNRGGMKNLEYYESLARSLSIETDETSQHCNTSKQKADTLLLKVRESDVFTLKSENLALQGKPLKKLVALTQEQYKCKRNHTDNLSYDMDKLDKEKMEQRQEQIRLMKKSGDLFESFLRYFLDFTSVKRFYFLKWMKFNLDEESKQRERDECNIIHQGVYEDKSSSLHKGLDVFDKKFTEASFGLEHFIREIGQVFEAVECMKSKVPAIVPESTINRVSLLPKILAELMLQGFPLEIMDGDALHIPLTWIVAVLEQLTILIGDKKVFVIAVLGAVSSGKSTLLNTMFGLQFKEASGRCTRGVHAQLIPLSREYSAKYDYLMIVDTEGFRESGGYDVKQRDNKIATLVIGMSDVTLVNVKGENIFTTENIFQVVVPALLKIKLNLDLQPSCFFIHQNADSIDAQRLRHSRQTLIRRLDMLTKTAAQKVGQDPPITIIDQVIDIESTSYFPNLWKGDPPMAPVNIGYSEQVRSVRRTLLTDIMDKRTSQTTIEIFAKKLSKLWDGILDQNFVFKDQS